MAFVSSFEAIIHTGWKCHTLSQHRIKFQEKIHIIITEQYWRLISWYCTVICNFKQHKEPIFYDDCLEIDNSYTNLDLIILMLSLYTILQIR